VNARWASTDAQTRCIAFLQCLTSVKAAQAQGDCQVLAEGDRCTLRAHLGPDGAAGLATLHAAITAALVSS
jgi:hypothetical protein